MAMKVDSHKKTEFQTSGKLYLIFRRYVQPLIIFLIFIYCVKVMMMHFYRRWYSEKYSIDMAVAYVLAPWAIITYALVNAVIVPLYMINHPYLTKARINDAAWPWEENKALFIKKLPKIIGTYVFYSSIYVTVLSFIFTCINPRVSFKDLPKLLGICHSYNFLLPY